MAAIEANPLLFALLDFEKPLWQAKELEPEFRI